MDSSTNTNTSLTSPFPSSSDVYKNLHTAEEKPLAPGEQEEEKDAGGMQGEGFVDVGPVTPTLVQKGKGDVGGGVVNPNFVEKGDASEGGDKGGVEESTVSTSLVVEKGGVLEGGEKGAVDGGVVDAGLLEKGGGVAGGVKGSSVETGVSAGEGVVSPSLVEKDGALGGGEKESGPETGVSNEEVPMSPSLVDKVDVLDDGDKGPALGTGVSEGGEAGVLPRDAVVNPDLEVGSGGRILGADEKVPVSEAENLTTAEVIPTASEPIPTTTEVPAHPAESAGLGGDVVKDLEDMGVVAQSETEDKANDTSEEAIASKPVEPEPTIAEPTMAELVNNRNIDDADNIQSPVIEPVESNGGADDIVKNDASAAVVSETTEGPASEVFNVGAGGGYASAVKEVETTKGPASEVLNADAGGGDAANEVKTLDSSDEHFQGREMPEEILHPVDYKNAAGVEQIDSVGEVDNRKMPELPNPADNGHAKPISDGNISVIATEEEKPELNEVEDGGSPISDGPAKIAILGSPETAKQILKDLDKGSPSTSSRDFSPQMEGQIVSDSDEEAETDEEGDGKELFDSAALAALLRAATGSSSDGNITISAPDAARIFSVDRPAGLGTSVPSLRPAPARAARSSLFSPSDVAVVGDAEMDEEEKKLHDKVEQIRVKFLRLVHRLGHSPEDTVAAQVLYRLGLAEGIKRGRQSSRAFSLESAKKKALQLEENGQENLEFSCNILVLGKSGVGKSETINSIFGERVANTNAFQPATNHVKEIVGVVDGVKVRLVDTPGLTPSVMDQTSNKRILSSIKKYTKKCPPDIVLYVDRLDTQTRDFNDLPLLRSITSTLGSSIWFNAIVALTHAASAPPDGPNGTTLSYDVFVAQRSHVVQHSVRQAAGDMRLMNPVALVENHPSCRRNREGQRVLPNGITWRPQLLLLCYSSKTLSEANSLLKLQDPSPGKLFGFRVRSPPLPYLLSSLLQSRPHPKLANDQGDNGDSDIDLGDMSDSDQEEEEDEYDQLPPFKPLKKAQIEKLTKEQKKAYYDEYEYRVKLLQKKQWKEEVRRMKEMKKRGKGGQPQIDPSYGETTDDYDQDGAPAAVPVPLPDMVLPPTFDCENPAYRYRFLEPTSQLLARPVLDSHGWDHDCGYDGVSLEENLALAGRFPGTVAVQITKDKKEFNIHMDSSIAAKLGENGSSLAGFDIQSVGKQLAYILRSETKFKNLKKNKTAAGMSVTFLGENVATGLKIEDQILIGNRVSLAASTGAIRCQGDAAYGANLEAKLREDYPIGQEISTLGLSLMKWRGDLALGANLQSQFSLGRSSKMAVRVGLNNKLTGQITVRTSSSEQLQIAFLGILPIAVSVFRSIFPSELVK